MKVALVYDRVNKWGGAERVLLAFHKIFPGASLFTSVYNKEKAPWASVFKNVKTSFLQKFPLASSFHQFYATLMPIAFESFSFDKYDLVISVTSEAAKGIITKPGTLHICYCLTPTRYLWSSYDDYFKNPYLRFFSKPAVKYLRAWDKVVANRPDIFIATSKEVRSRIKKYYGRDSTVVYPPAWGLGLSEARPTPVKQASSFVRSTRVTPNSYFLVVSRLESYKRIDLAIKACNTLKVPLKIVGRGWQEEYLKNISGRTIEFLGEVTDRELSSCYRNCKALISAGIEDFGLSMVEAQAAGRPVIAFRGGGAVEIVKEGVTGQFFNKQDPKSLTQVLEKWSDTRYNSSLCIENSKKFSFENFRIEILKILEKL